MTYSIAFHSYKGGTGKTTIACNLSAYLALQGKTVCLIDLDVYAPSLKTYFEIEPKKWINDFMYSNAKVEDILNDFSFLIEKTNKHNNMNNGDSYNKEVSNGKLFIGFSSSKSDDLQKLDLGEIESRKQLLRKLIAFRELIIKKYHPDYIIIDTSPGIRFWSLNALAMSDIFFLTLKAGDIDLKGTRNVIKEIYESFTQSGSMSFLLLNKVQGYCTPSNKSITIQQNMPYDKLIKEELIKEAKNSDEMGLDVIGSIPCYCDIQFSQREFLTSIRDKDHPFSKSIELLAKYIQKEINPPL